MREALSGVTGNSRVCVFMEPFFAIPYTMYAGYMTLYMLELGMTKQQVGLVTSLGLAVHILFSMLSTFVTDKLGRKTTTLIFDVTGWGLAQLVWAVALDIRYFVVGAVLNASFRIVANSWQCLLLEDSKPDARVHIFNFMHLSGVVAGFFAPVGALYISRAGLVPAMRVLIFISAAVMTTLFIFRNFIITETSVGKIKKQEMKGVRMRDVFKSYLPAFKRIMSNRLLIFALFLRALNFIQITIRSTFLAVLVTEGLNFPPEVMAVFHIAGSVVMLLTMLTVAPVLTRVTRQWPVAIAIGFHIAAVVILLITPDKNYPLLILSAVFIALGTSVSTPRIEAMVANCIVNEERSLANAIVEIVILGLTTPFGYIGGVLAAVDARLPFLLTLAILLACLVLLRAAGRYGRA